MIKKLILIIIFVLTLTGCWDQRIYERTGFILEFGAETGKDKKLLITYSLPVVGTERKNQVEIDTVEGNVLRESREEARTTSSKLLEGGKVQQVLFSDELAEKGIHNVEELLFRDPMAPAMSFVTVVDGSPRTLIEKASTFSDKPIPALYINQLITNNINHGYSMDSSITYFEICYYTEGLDPITPLIKLEDKDIKVLGSALFSGDKMVGTISTKQTSQLIALMNKLPKTEYIFPSPTNVEKQTSQKDGMAVTIKEEKSKIDVAMTGKQAEVNISLSLKVDLDEYQWDDTDNVDVQKKLEAFMSKQLNQDILSTISYTQSVGSDPLGVGDMLRAKYFSHFKDSDLKRLYENAKVTVNTKVTIDKFGITR
ncbi:MAG: Ger(x)C family spore germination protein [Bacillota bacterium]|nr:Ger(x)C family spore germination protein [Bacillota bacterium]